MKARKHYEQLEKIKGMVVRLKENHGDKTTQNSLQIIECAIQSEIIKYKTELGEY